MSELKVRLVRLEPMRVASVHAFGSSPEHDAWDKLMDWAGSKGLLKAEPAPRVFGFNNPDPSPGSPNYGYEFWIEVGPEVESDDVATVKDFPGGLYAVTRCQGVSNISDTWHRLATWMENSEHEFGSHQWLEGHVGPLRTPQDDEALRLDLHMPIVG
jgi:DNA gyrase inhibitor GyrI